MTPFCSQATWLVAAGAIFLSGCVSTLFESAPGIAATTCDIRWVGTWELHPLDPKINAEDRIVLTVDPACKRFSYTENGKAQHDLDDAVVAFSQGKRNKVLALKMNVEPSAGKPAPSFRDIGYRYFSYVAKDNEIRVQQADDDAVARLIIDGKLDGRTEKISRYPGQKQPSDGRRLVNFVAGSPEDMAHVLDSYALFSDKGAIILKRIKNLASTSAPATSKEITPATNQP